MNEDYLWDKSGEPDSEIARLENLLAPLACPATVTARVPGNYWKATRWWLAAAAALTAVASCAWWLRTPAPQAAWRIAAAYGSPRTNGRYLQARGTIYSGQLLETDAVSRITLQSESVGEVELGPESRLRVESAAAGNRRLALQQGTIHATIWAPPERFVVDTPSAKAIDLGCAYTLHVDPSGDGLLTVEIGWVAFQFHGIESFIPAGAACSTRRMSGPGLPYFLDASDGFRAAVREFDSGERGNEIGAILAGARPQDALTLWHLLERLPPSQRGRVYDRFAALVRLPATVTKERVVGGDREALDAAWDALDLGDTDWWRHWRREW